MKYIPITEEQFFDTVDNWIYELTGEGEANLCGFCTARVQISALCGKDDESNKTACFADSLCLGNDSAYYRSLNTIEREQAILEILEGLWKIGKKLGFYGILENKMVAERCNACGQEFYLRAGQEVVSSKCPACGEGYRQYSYRTGARGI